MFQGYNTEILKSTHRIMTATTKRTIKTIIILISIHFQTVFSTLYSQVSSISDSVSAIQMGNQSNNNILTFDRIIRTDIDENSSDISNQSTMFITLNKIRKRRSDLEILTKNYKKLNISMVDKKEREILSLYTDFLNYHLYRSDIYLRNCEYLLKDRHVIILIDNSIEEIKKSKGFRKYIPKIDSKKKNKKIKKMIFCVIALMQTLNNIPNVTLDVFFNSLVLDNGIEQYIFKDVLNNEILLGKVLKGLISEPTEAKSSLLRLQEVFLYISKNSIKKASVIYFTDGKLSTTPEEYLGHKKILKNFLNVNFNSTMDDTLLYINICGSDRRLGNIAKNKNNVYLNLDLNSGFKSMKPFILNNDTEFRLTIELSRFLTKLLTMNPENLPYFEVIK